MAQRHGRILQELSELLIASARDLAERQLQAEDGQAAAEAAQALHRVSRSLRQTMALEAKLERERRRAEREDASHDARTQEARVRTRKAQVKAAVERLIWTEAEADEAERLEDELSDLLDEEALYEGFVADPVEAHVERVRTSLGLGAPPPRTADPQAHRDGLPWPPGAPSSPPPHGPPSPVGGAGMIPDYPWGSSA